MFLRGADNFHTSKKRLFAWRAVNSVGAQLLQAPLSSEDEDGDDISVEGEEGEEGEEKDDASSD
eukprot:1160076-Pelagomonas_calceolata.AAC.4